MPSKRSRPSESFSIPAHSSPTRESQSATESSCSPEPPASTTRFMKKRKQNPSLCSGCVKQTPTGGRKTCDRCYERSKAASAVVKTSARPVSPGSSIAEPWIHDAGQLFDQVLQMCACDDRLGRLADILATLPLQPEERASLWAQVESFASSQEPDRHSTTEVIVPLRMTNVELSTLPMPKNRRIVIVADDLHNLDAHLDNFLSLWQHTSPASLVRTHSYSREGHLDGMTAMAFARRLRDRQQAPWTLIPYDPKQYLPWEGQTFHVPRPTALLRQRFTLLDNLIRRVQLAEPAPLPHPRGNAHELCLPNLTCADMHASLVRSYFDERGAAWSWQFDVLNGTWFTTISGRRLWFVYDGPWEAGMAKQGYVPPRQHVRSFVTQPGETLLFRPGHLVAYSVVTLDDSYMVGGSMWAADGVRETIENLSSLVSPKTIGWKERYVLPALLDALLSLLHDAPREESGAIEAVKQLQTKLRIWSSCSCVESCGNACGCRTLGGCTVWCHDGAVKAQVCVEEGDVDQGLVKLHMAEEHVGTQNMA